MQVKYYRILFLGEKPKEKKRGKEKQLNKNTLKKAAEGQIPLN